MDVDGVADVVVRVVGCVVVAGNGSEDEVVDEVVGVVVVAGADVVVDVVDVREDEDGKDDFVVYGQGAEAQRAMFALGRRSRWSR